MFGKTDRQILDSLRVAVHELTKKVESLEQRLIVIGNATASVKLASQSETVTCKECGTARTREGPLDAPLLRALRTQLEKPKAGK